jgi:hypothetical protein
MENNRLQGGGSKVVWVKISLVGKKRLLIGFMESFDRSVGFLLLVYNPQLSILIRLKNNPSAESNIFCMRSNTVVCWIFLFFLAPTHIARARRQKNRPPSPPRSAAAPPLPTRRYVRTERKKTLDLR